MTTENQEKSTEVTALISVTEAAGVKKGEVSTTSMTEINTVMNEFYHKALELKSEAMAINVESLDQKKDIERAREMRLKIFRPARTNLDKKRKELKEESVKKGKAIDKAAKHVREFIEKIEAHLQKQEDFEKIELEKQRQVKLKSRLQICQDAGIDVDPEKLMTMDDEIFDIFVDGKKKIIAEEKAKAEEDERKRKEEAAREEEKRRKTEEENERLRKENEKKERELEEERKQRKREEDKRKARTAELQPYIVFIRDYESMLNMDDDAYQAELADVKKGAEEQWEYERKEKERLDREEEERKQKEREEAIERKKKEDEEKKRKFGSDKEKLSQFMEDVNELSLPQCSTNEGKAVVAGINEMRSRMIKYIQDKMDQMQ